MAALVGATNGLVIDGRGTSSRAGVRTGADLHGRHSIHNLGLVGHIEDIAVTKDQQGKRLGLRIIQALDYIGEKIGCYKVSPAPRSWQADKELTELHSPFLTAVKPTKAFTSSADTSALGWRWHIIMIHQTRVQVEAKSRRELRRCEGWSAPEA